MTGFMRFLPLTALGIFLYGCSDFGPPDVDREEMVGDRDEGEDVTQPGRGVERQEPSVTFGPFEPQTLDPALVTDGPYQPCGHVGVGLITHHVYSADGASIFLATATGELRRIDARQGSSDWSHRRAHDGMIQALAVSSNGRYVATASGRTVRLWSATDGALLFTRQADKQISALAISPDGAQIAYGQFGDNVAPAVVVRSLVTDELVGVPIPVNPMGIAEQLAFTPDGAHLVGTTHANGYFHGAQYVSWSVDVWRTADWTSTLRVPGLVFALSDDGETLAVGVEVGDLTIIPLADPAAARTTSMERSDPILELAFTPDGGTVASRAYFSTRVQAGFNPITLTDLADLRSKSGSSPRGSGRFVISPDGQSVVYGSEGLLVRPLHPDADDDEDGCGAGRCSTLVPRIKNTRVQLSDEGLLIAIGQDDAAWLWNMETGERLERYPLTLGANTVAISPDGERIVAGGQLIERETDVELGRLRARRHAVFSRDRTRLGTDVSPTAIKRWDLDLLPAGEIFDWAPRSVVGSAVTSLDISDDGSLLAAADRKTVYVIDAEGRVSPYRAESPISQAVLHPNGESVFAVTGVDRVLSWRFEDAAEPLLLGPEAANTLALSPVGDVMVVQFSEAGWLLVDPATGETVQRLPWINVDPFAASARRVGAGDRRPIARFTGDGDRLATASGDGVVQLWCRDGAVD